MTSPPPQAPKDGVQAVAQRTDAQGVRVVARACGTLTLAVAAFVLTGWATNAYPSASLVMPGLAWLVPNTAVALAAAGLALWLLLARLPPSFERPARLTTPALAALPLLMNLLTLVEVYTGYELFADRHLLAPEYLTANATLSLTLLGVALLLLLQRRHDRLVGLAQLLGLVAALSGLRVLFGLVDGDGSTYRLLDPAEVSLPIAATNVLMGLGLLTARADQGMMAVVSGPGYGSHIFRRLLPAVVLLPLAIGTLTLQGHVAGRFDVGLGMIGLTFANLLVFWWLARALNTSDSAATREAARAQNLLQLAERRIGRLQALRRIDLATMYEHQAFGSMLDVLIEQTRAQLNVDAVAVLLAQPGRDTLGYARRSGFHTNPRPIAASTDESYLGVALREKQTAGNAGVASRAPQPAHASAEGFVTGYAASMVVEGQITGLLEIGHRSALEFDAEGIAFLETLAGQGAIAHSTFLLFTDLERSNEALTRAYDETLAGWGYALELRDGETRGHTQRVTELTIRLAEAFDITGDELTQIRRGAMLHDIGKLGIPDSILLKHGRLTDEEWAVMRKHPIYAYHWLRPIAYLWPALAIPYCHHERWDGQGYPQGLKGEEIPFEARLFAVVDVWDALCSERPYHPPWTSDAVRAYLHKHAGSHFDPHIVEVFLQVVSDADVPQVREAGK